MRVRRPGATTGTIRIIRKSCPEGATTTIRTIRTSRTLPMAPEQLAAAPQKTPLIMGVAKLRLRRRHRSRHRICTATPRRRLSICTRLHRLLRLREQTKDRRRRLRVRVRRPGATTGTIRNIRKS